MYLMELEFGYFNLERKWKMETTVATITYNYWNNSFIYVRSHYFVVGVGGGGGKCIIIPLYTYWNDLLGSELDVCF